MLQTIQTLIYVGGALLLALIVCLSLPNSRLREVAMPIVGWGFAIFCGAYLISPLDVMPETFFGPFGLIDDAGALVLGILSARAALNANKK